MAELSEEQLLLLDNLMYYDGAAQTGRSVEQIAIGLIRQAENYDKGSLTLSGGFESAPDQIIEIANAILKDKQLCDLTVTDSVNTKGVRASCFVDRNGEATVAVRGTGGTYEAWSDNIEGAFDISTECQQEFLSFMKKQAAHYDNITVTGHSKGGNLAQYATILLGEDIDRCVSFDGQGFNEKFCKKYKKEIAANKDKIKSICGKDDYVNILLTSVAGETVYLAVTEGENAHSSYALWERNQDTQKDGEYSNTVDQSSMLRVADVMVDGLVKIISWLPDKFEKRLVEALGAAVGAGFSVSTGQFTVANLAELFLAALFLVIPDWLLPDAIKNQIKKYFESVIERYKDETQDSSGGGTNGNKGDSDGTGDISYLVPVAFKVRCNELARIAGEMGGYERSLNRLSNSLKGIRLDGGFPGMNNKLDAIARQINTQGAVMKSMGSTLKEVQNTYQQAEVRICASVV